VITVSYLGWGVGVIYQSLLNCDVIGFSSVGVGEGDMR